MIALQVDEIRRRQAMGLIDPKLDPELVRLAVLALASYPRIQRQVTWMTTSLKASDAAFEARWTAFLRDIGHRLSPR